jgi:hypothetical protein
MRRVSKDAEIYLSTTHDSPSGAMAHLAIAWINWTNEEEAWLKMWHCEANGLLTPEQSRLKAEQGKRMLRAMDRFIAAVESAKQAEDLRK